MFINILGLHIMLNQGFMAHNLVIKLMRYAGSKAMKEKGVVAI
jgi:hypothetical protein